MIDVPIELFKPIAAKVMRQIIKLDEDIHHLTGLEKIGETKDYTIGELEITIVYFEGDWKSRSRWTIQVLKLRDIRIGLASFKPRIYRMTYEDQFDVEEALMMIALLLP